MINIKKSQILLKIILIPALIFIFTAAQCNEEEEKPLESQVSAIQPKPVLFSGTERIPLLSPFEGQSGFQALGTPFVFDATGIAYGTLLVFDGAIEPSAAALKDGDATGCIAGVSNMAGHSWNGVTANPANLFLCQNNAMEPLTNTLQNLTVGIDYYWVVLGFDENFALTHSSAAQLFTY